MLEDWLLVTDRSGWPVHLVYAIEIVAVLAAALLAASRRRLALPAAILSGLAIAYPIALAPFFFGVSGEWMLVTLPAFPVLWGLGAFVSFKVLRAIDG